MSSVVLGSMSPWGIPIWSKASFKRTFTALLVSTRTCLIMQWLMSRVTTSGVSYSSCLCLLQWFFQLLVEITLTTLCFPAFSCWLVFWEWYSRSPFFLRSYLWSAHWAMKSLSSSCQIAFSISFRSSMHCSVSCPWSQWKSHYFVLSCLSGREVILVGAFRILIDSISCKISVRDFLSGVKGRFH